jgi:hypothetical protein
MKHLGAVFIYARILVESPTWDMEAGKFEFEAVGVAG